MILKLNWFVRLNISAIVIWTSLNPVWANAQSTDETSRPAAPGDVRILADLEIPDKGRVELGMTVSSEELAKAASPRTLRRVKLYPSEVALALKDPQDPGSRDIHGHLQVTPNTRLTTRQTWVRESTFAIPMDTIPFWAASGIMEYMLHDKGDPAFLANYVKNNITSAPGVVSLFAFTYINR